MDFISHALIGQAMAASKERSRAQMLLVALFSFLPDLPLLFFYVYVGAVKMRPWLIPMREDINALYAAHPGLAAFWEIPHSLLLAVALLPIAVLIFRLPKIVGAVYAVHIAVDVLTHAENWTMSFFWPFNTRVEGLADAWQWPLYPNIIIAWAIGVIFWVAMAMIKKHKK